MEAIAHVVIECLKDHNKGQNYVGAQCMSSDKVGVQARIKLLYPRALYVHCSSHVPNLSIAKAYRLPAIRNMVDTLNTVFLFSICPPNDNDSRNES